MGQETELMAHYINPEPEHITSLLRWLQKAVMDQWGDGYALWYSSTFSVRDLLPIVQEMKGDWELTGLEGLATVHGDSTIKWYNGMEGIIITNDLEGIEEASSGYHVVLRY